VYEILRTLQPGSVVLDLGSARGSFPQEATAADVVRVDRDAQTDPSRCGMFAQADAVALPFADCTFAAVVSNHSLEHFDDLTGALKEIARVISPGGSLFIAVPDASTITDRLYRWLARGGGHVNSFTSPNETAAAISQVTGLAHVATKPLCSSLSFLNRYHAPRPIPGRLLLLGAGYEWSLFLYVWLSRRFDRCFHFHTSRYGWAFYFGGVREQIDETIWVNVCIRCGSGCSASLLKQQELVRANCFGISVFRCAECGASNPFAEDPGFGV
jgi:SAM-dependent methyltransferase